ncbi:MAG: hypothetical protein ACYDBB_02220 [Armatimonadota bacterium]
MSKCWRVTLGKAGAGWVCVLLPFLLFVLHATLFRGWIVDDAGISFAYARSFAGGNGLVSQPGMMPVEGFSNPAWVLLLTPFFLLHLFDPHITSKFISLALVLVAFGLISRVVTLAGGNRWVTTAILTLVALNTSIVVWTTSGLENPLYLTAVCLLLYLSLRVLAVSNGLRWAAAIGLATGLLALVRPDGLLFVSLFPLVVLPLRAFAEKLSWRVVTRELIAFLGAFLLVFGGYVIFRIGYYHALLPNTYAVKVGGSVHPLIQQFGLSTMEIAILLMAVLLLAVVIAYLLSEKRLTPVRAWTIFLTGVVIANLTILHGLREPLIGLFASIAGGWWPVMLGVGLVGFGWLLCTNRVPREQFMLFAVMVWTLFVYLLLPPDWMGEYRFATLFLAMWYLFFVTTTHLVLASLSISPQIQTITAVSLLAVLLGISIPLFRTRSQQFAANPTVSLATVTQRYGLRFNDYARRLGLHQASVLLPDLGGALYYSHLQVYDLGGLCDRRIALNRYRQHKSDLWQYVFVEVRPTFIHTHDFWNFITQLQCDSRFQRDYVPILEYQTPILRQYNQQYHQYFVNGDYVRRDAIRGREKAFDHLRQQYAGSEK